MSKKFSGFSMTDLYPGIGPIASTQEKTQPEEAEAVKYSTTEQGTIMDTKKKTSIFGALLLLVVILFALGVLK